MAKKSKKVKIKVKVNSPKGFEQFTIDTINALADSLFEEDSLQEEIETTLLKAEIEEAARDVLDGFTILEIAHKYKIEEKDAKVIYDAVVAKKAEVNAEG